MRLFHTHDSASIAKLLKRKQKLADDKLSGLKWPVLIILFVVALDQITKLWALSTLTEHSSVHVFGEFFMFTLVFNEGGAMGTSFGPSGYYLVTALIILPALLAYIYISRRQASVALPLSFIAGGAIGNVIDRIRLGKVVDFIDVDFFDVNLFGYHLDRWWTFNIADAAITCSILFILIGMIQWPKRKAVQS